MFKATLFFELEEDAQEFANGLREKGMKVALEFIEKIPENATPCDNPLVADEGCVLCVLSPDCSKPYSMTLEEGKA